jgi:hypothetical protein
MAAFRADADGRFDHDLAGWNELRSAAGNTPAARELFLTVLDHEPSGRLVAAFGTPAELPLLIAARRQELYTRMYGIGADRASVKPTAADLAAVLLAEILSQKQPVVDRRFGFAVGNILLNPGPVRDAFQGTGPAAEAYRKLIAGWLLSRTDATELSSALTTASSLNLKEAPPVVLAERVLNLKTVPFPTSRFYALAALARTEDKAHLPTLRRWFGEPAASQAIRNRTERVTVQTGDVALLFTLQMLGRKPEEYGFDPWNGPGVGGTTTKYVWNAFVFPTDERRKFGQIKFVWEEARAKLK